jgi:Outer membrane lipoprotein-sorting protein
MPTRALALLLSVFVPGILIATELPAISDPEIQACIDKMMPAKSLTQRIVLRSFDGSGLIEESIANLYWRRADGDKSRAVIRLTAPPSRQGLAVLMVESDSPEPTMYLYIPDLKRSRRVTGKQLASSMMGTDFSYEEFSHFQKTAAESDTRRIEDQTVGGSPAYVLETLPGGGDSAYSRILTFVDQARCIPLQTQFFGPDGGLGKELLAAPEEIKAVGNRYVPHRVVMHDRKKNTRTELSVENVAIDVDLSDAIFSPKRLGLAP